MVWYPAHHKRSVAAFWCQESKVDPLPPSGAVAGQDLRQPRKVDVDIVIKVAEPAVVDRGHRVLVNNCIYIRHL